MRIVHLLFLTALIWFACSSKKVSLENNKSDLLEIKELKPNIFQHISYLDTKSYGKVPCNGMVYVNEGEAVIFDTPVNDSASKELLNWLADYTVKAVVCTHFHVDCLGGLAEFHRRGIPSYALNKTLALAQQDDVAEIPKNGFDTELEFVVGEELAYVKYFGSGHTPDNVVGYVPSESALFGGCLVKADGASKGNLTDADTSQWSTTVDKIYDEILEIELVIPGHGAAGGKELLDYTRDLFLIE